MMVYRPKVLLNPRATVRRWRTHFQAAGLGDPYIVMAQSHGKRIPVRMAWTRPLDSPA